MRAFFNQQGNSGGKHGNTVECYINGTYNNIDTLIGIIISMSYPLRLKNIGITLIDQYTTAKAHHRMRCDSCNHVWSATPISKLQNYKKYKTNGCPACHTHRKRTLADKINRKNISKMESLGFSIQSEYTTYKSPIVVRNNNCNHTWTTTPERIIGSNVKCKICNDLIKQTRFTIQNAKRKQTFNDTASDWERYKSDVRKKTEQQFIQHQSTLNPNNHPRGLAGLEGVYQLDHIISVKWCFENDVPYDKCSDVSNLQFIPWQQNLHKKHRMITDYIPKSIQPFFIDNHSSANCLFGIRKLLTDNDIIFQKDVRVLNPYKVDIFIPSTDTAIRVYDINTECEQNIMSTNIQRNIIKIAEKRNIRLIQLFSDEWISNPELIASKILHICKMGTTQTRIHARKCTIREINSSIKNEFLNMYHIQGTDRSQISIGAYYGDKLVSVMTFSKPRKMMGRSPVAGVWELSRLTTDTHFRIPGIASKLLTYFKRNHRWSKIYSYADARWSIGNVYEQLKFVKTHHNKPSYWYVVDGVRKHRWGYRKDSIRERFPHVYHKSKTEYEMMLELDIDRIWDAGTILYQINRKQ